MHSKNILKTRAIGKLFIKQFQHRSISTSKIIIANETTIPNLPGYLLKPIEPSYNEKVMDFLMKTFFVEEPINKSVNLMGDAKSVQATKEFYWDNMNSGVSIMLIDEQDNVVSAMLNDIEYRHNRNRKIITRDGIAHNKMLQICNIMKDKTNPFDIYPDLNEYIEMCAGSVDVKLRSKKILRSMMQLMIDTARNSNFKLMRMEATNFHSGRVAESMGFKDVYSIKFKDYRINDEIVFNIEPPHDEISIKFLEL